MPNIGPGELILILIIALVVLGPGKLPDVAQSLGKSVREFRKAATDVADAGKLDAPAATPAASAPAAPTAPTAEATPPAQIPAPPAAPVATAPGADEPARDPNLS
jgi:sec-independent protein translocase protein TatA